MTYYTTADGTFHTEDAMESFLESNSVDLFITNPPFYGIHAQEYGNFEDQMHNTGDISDFIYNLTRVVLGMEKALRPGGNILLLLPNKPFFLDSVLQIKNLTSLSFGQLLVWDLGLSESSIDNYSAVVVNFYNTEQTDPGNQVIRLPIDTADSLEEFEQHGFVKDTLPVEIYTFLIEKFAKPGGVVSDILGGTGSICLAALATGHKFVYNDVSTEQTAVAVSRYQAHIKNGSLLS